MSTVGGESAKTTAKQEGSHCGHSVTTLTEQFQFTYETIKKKHHLFLTTEKIFSS